MPIGTLASRATTLTLSSVDNILRPYKLFIPHSIFFSSKVRSDTEVSPAVHLAPFSLITLCISSLLGLVLLVEVIVELTVLLKLSVQTLWVREKDEHELEMSDFEYVLVLRLLPPTPIEHSKSK